MMTQWEATIDALIDLRAEEVELQKKIEALNKDEEEFASLLVVAEQFGYQPTN